MKRITRQERLSPEEADKYETIREQVAAELPDLIDRHHERKAKKETNHSRKRRWPWLVLVVVVIGTWLIPKYIPLPFTVAVGYQQYSSPMNHSLSEIVKGDQPVFHIDSARPWQIDFGRGSGWHGLDTTKINEEGFLVLHRMRKGSWETATHQLTPYDVGKILEAVESNHLMELEKEYHADIADGTQWVL